MDDLVTEDARRTAVLVRAPAPEYGRELASVQVVSTDPDAAPRVAAQIRAASLEHNVFRGQVLSFGQEVFGHGRTLLDSHDELVSLGRAYLDACRWDTRQDRPGSGG